MASEKKRQYQKEWWAKHREQKNAKRLRHYYKHREEILEKRKAKYELMKLDPLAMARKRESSRISAKKRSAQKRDDMATRPRPDRCESCGTIGTVVYDHVHETGEFRGWLCSSCNIALGHLRDNPALIKALAGYLASHFYRGEYERLGLELSPSVISRENR